MQQRPSELVCKRRNAVDCALAGALFVWFDVARRILLHSNIGRNAHWWRHAGGDARSAADALASGSPHAARR